MSDQIGRLLEEQYGMARNRLGDFSATSPLNRESGNVEDGRARANEPWLKRTVEQLASDVDVWRDYLKRSVEARGLPPVSMQEISALLPTQEIGPMVPGGAAHKVPFPPKRTERLAEQPPADGGYLRYLATMPPRRADGGSVGDILSRAWDSRPWKGYATNPPSMAPQIGIALGLLNPTLGRATRDMSMARGVSTPAMVKPPKEASAAASAPPSVQPGLPMWQLRENYARGPANSNKPLSNVERYEAYLSRMYDQGAEPVTFRAFLRGIE